MTVSLCSHVERMAMRALLKQAADSDLLQASQLMPLTTTAGQHQRHSWMQVKL